MQIPKDEVLRSVSFGLTSGVITALGMIVGLDTATNSRLAVITGIVILAVAGGLADAIGWHSSDESRMKNGKPMYGEKQLWIITLLVFLSDFSFIASFIIPMIIFELKSALLISIIWGMALLIGLNIYIAKMQKKNVLSVVLQHVIIATIVLVVSYFAGMIIDILM